MVDAGELGDGFAALHGEFDGVALGSACEISRPSALLAQCCRATNDRSYVARTIVHATTGGVRWAMQGILLPSLLDCGCGFLKVATQLFGEFGV